MRNAEKINLLFFSFFLILALLPRYTWKQRIKTMAIGATGAGLILAMQFLHRFVSLLSASVIRDWLPAGMMLMAYWQAGNLFIKPNEKLQNRLANFDRIVLPTLAPLLRNSWTKSYLELSYLLCYPLVPLGIGILYMTHLGRYADEFWTAVLPPTYLCHALVPFTQTLPPWKVEQNGAEIVDRGKIRAFNFWIIQNASIHANTLPSAHVATSMAMSLMLLRLVPVAGCLFLWISISIAIAAVAGRYHYTVDVLTGAAAALIMFAFLYSGF